MGGIRIKPDAIRHDAEAGRLRQLRAEERARRRKHRAVVVGLVVAAGATWWLLPPRPVVQVDTPPGIANALPLPEQLQGPPRNLSPVAPTSEKRRPAPEPGPATVGTADPEALKREEAARLEREAADRRAADEAAAKLGAAKLEAAKLEAERLERLAAEKIETEKRLAAEKLLTEKLAAQKLAADRLAAEKLAAQKSTTDKLAAQKLANDRLAAQKIAADKLVADKLAADRREAERLAAERLGAERVAAEQRAAARFFSTVAGRWKRRDEVEVASSPPPRSLPRRQITQEEVTVSKECVGTLKRSIKVEIRDFAGWEKESEDIRTLSFRCDSAGRLSGEVSGQIAVSQGSMMTIAGSVFRR